MFKRLQMARLKKCPEEMVKLISFTIPPGADVDNPSEDIAFMARIGAKLIPPKPDTPFGP